MLIFIYWLYITELSRAWVHRVKLSKVCDKAVFCVVTQSSSTKGGALRDQQISLKHGPRTAGCQTGASLSSLLHFNRFRFNLHKMSLRYQFSISSPRLFGTISSWLSVTAYVYTTTYFKKKLKLYFLSLNWVSAGFSKFIVSLFVTSLVSVIGLHACKLT